MLAFGAKRPCREQFGCGLLLNVFSLTVLFLLPNQDRIPSTLPDDAGYNPNDWA
jgi:hypothetical protein